MAASAPAGPDFSSTAEESRVRCRSVAGSDAVLQACINEASDSSRRHRREWRWGRWLRRLKRRASSVAVIDSFLAPAPLISAHASFRSTCREGCAPAAARSSAWVDRRDGRRPKQRQRRQQA